MANQYSSGQSSASYEKNLRRNKLRRSLLEALERRELLASDFPAGPVFAPGTSQEYVNSVIGQYSGQTNSGGEGNSGEFNAPGPRWSNPVGGPSANAGDPSTVTWSLVPDGTIDTTGGGSQATNLISFMDAIYGGGTGPVENRPWFNIFQRAYDQWSDVSGINFVYEPADDGANMGGSNRGVAGVRGDVRIGGRNIDGNFGTLAFNYFPNNGGNAGFDGDMIIDTNDVFYFNTADGPTGENRGLFNVLMHEAGHGIGLGHTIPVNQTKLMEPNISFAFLGAQHDDILGAQVLYGDPDEINDTRADATDLGTIGNGLLRKTGNSLDAESDGDWYKFAVPSSGKITIELEPIGETYIVGNQGGTTAQVNTLTNQDLSFKVFASDGTELAAASATLAGEIESVVDLDLPAGGDYFVEIAGVGDQPQLYNLAFTVKGVIDPTSQQTPPRLLSVAPNVGEIFSFNRTNDLEEGPSELVFSFDGSRLIDPSSFGGVRLTRSGNDDEFDGGNEVVITPGWVGFGETERNIVARFAEPLIDDLYKVEVFGVDIASEGITAVTNINGEALDPRVDGTDRDTLFFDLELGAKVIAVVPQPTTTNADGTVEQSRDTIEVYFNNDDLHETQVTSTGAMEDPTVVKPEFYQLILTEDTVTPGDDTVFNPTSITYDPVEDKAVLTFDNNIDELAGGAGTFRLRVGSNTPVDSELNPPNVGALTPGADPNGFQAGAFGLGSVGFGFSTVVSESLLNVQNQLQLDYPGDNFSPGHRDIQDQNHLGGGEDDSPFITQAFYNFALDRSYGTDAFGQPVFTSITPEQIQRVREIYEFYGAQLGIDFVETESLGMTVVVGDLFPNGAISGPGGVLGVASLDNLNGLAIMDGAENWNNELTLRDGAGGQFSFFGTAIHEVGHMLGIGHSYELPDGTLMGSTSALSNPGNPLEEIYPGDHDIVHASHGYRPDNKDVDLYQFDVPQGITGRISIETVAERLANSSNADTHLTLMKQTPNGLQVVATNNDYFSSDSFVTSEVDGGIYYIGVTSAGNQDFNPATDDTGSGGVSQGAYQLRVDFVPDVQSQIVDINGTALDGDGDGQAGGDFNFWFRAASPAGTEAAGAPKTVFVNKDFTGTSTGAPDQPFTSIPAASAAVSAGDIIRITGSRGQDGDLTTVLDNPAYEIGRGGVGNAVLSDGITFEVPRGVTAMIDAGAIFKMGGSRIVTGSRDAGVDNRFAALQVLGTPTQSVVFTSFDDESFGIDSNPIPTTPQPGQWGGLEFHNDVDREEGRGDYEREGIFINYVGQADMRFGGGQVTVSTPSPTINPIHLNAARPTILGNTITFSADSAISADPDSFEETRFTEPRYQLATTFRSDFERVGPDIRGNTLLDNSINGLFVRVAANPGQPIDTLDVQARFDDIDVTHVLGQNLIIAGTPGGAFLETTAPDQSLVTFSDAEGALTPGDTHSYIITFVDLNGAEGVPSPVTPLATVGPDGGVLLDQLPAATGEFVGRHLYRSANGGAGPFTLVAQLDGDTPTLLDAGQDRGSVLANPTATSIARARPDARLAIDPGVIVKSVGSRIEVGIGAQLIAEGDSKNPVIFTSRFDDRYGAGGTFDTDNDGASSQPAPGDWGGLIARHFSSISIDSALITFGGGVTSLPGGFAGFNAIEIHQAEARIANSVIEENASGLGGSLGATRDGRGDHDASVIFVRGAQPVIVQNVIRNNDVTGTAVISIDANSMKAIPVQDTGRQTGASDALPGELGNMGPLVSGNALALNGLNGMRIRGATLTTEAVWDDTDIVHVLESEIIVPDLHTFGGMRLQSKVDESLVVKLTAGAGITADGLPLDITDRIGGSLRIVGTPGFPVVLTSFRDDSVGAGFDPSGLPQVDTNSDGPSIGEPGDWRSIRLNPSSNDRNLDTVIELESDTIADVGVNDNALEAQAIGALADDLNAGDENLRLGFTVHGTIAANSDLDVYSFVGKAGTAVWVDIDRTDAALDTVVELIDVDGNIIAQSDDSLTESENGTVGFVDGSAIPPEDVNTFERSPYAATNTWSAAGAAKDFQSTNPADAGMRFVLPGAVGAENTYYLRVRSSNVGPNDAADRLQDSSLEREGLTRGAYRMQVRMQQADEHAGSTIRFADIRFATSGIEAIGLPAHSPLLGEGSELIGADIGSPTGAAQLGNIAASDRANRSVAGELTDTTEVDWFQFEVEHTNLQAGEPYVAVSFDIDYADGYGRPNTSLWIYRFEENAPGNVADDQYQLILAGTDSDIADDQDAPESVLGDQGDFTRGSFGSKDAFIGTQELLPGTYVAAVTNNTQVPTQFSQFQQAVPTLVSPDVRIEPLDSVNRISEDRFEGPSWPFDAPVTQTVAFNGGDLAGSNHVPFTLADVSTYVVRNQGAGSRLMLANALTGALDTRVGADFGRVNDVALSKDGRLVGYQIPAGAQTDANSGAFLLIDSAGDGATTSNSASGIQTFTTELTAAGPPPTFAVQQRTKGGAQVGDGIQFNALTFYDNAAQTSAGDVRLFGVGQRGDGNFVFNRPILDANGAIVGTTSTAGEPTNFIYRLDPVTGAAINANGLADRAGNARTNGAGTQNIELGSFVTADPTTPITGIAAIPGGIAAVSAAGELFVAGMGDGTAFVGAIPSVGVVDDGGPVAFTGLTRGPQNLEGGRFANILFGTTNDGTIYAMDFAGNLQNIFPGGNFKMRAVANNDLGTGIAGLDFSALDVNLWHVTNTRGNDTGHGRPETHNESRSGDQAGENSLYFGFQNAGNDNAARQAGDWDPIHAVYDNTYNLPGGAHGAIESQSLDLSGYSAEDLPMLYFNYYLQTQGQNSRLTPNPDMRDAFRVYASGSDGNWQLLSTNNSRSSTSFLDAREEIGVGAGNAIIQEAFDVGDAGAPDSWRQVRTSLAAFAGDSDVRLRFEFSSGATFNSGDSLFGGEELTASAGHLLNDGDNFTVTAEDGAGRDATFEFDMGLVLDLPAGAGIDEGDELEVNGVTFTFSQTSNAGNNIQYSPTDTPAQIAQIVAAKLPFASAVSSTRANVLNVDSPEGAYSVTGLPAATILGEPGVAAGNAAIKITQANTAEEVRDAMRTAFAANLNVVGQETNEDVWAVYGNTIKLYKFTADTTNSPALNLVNNARRGDNFAAGGAERAQNNAFEGVFVDDIIVGLAERGEQFLNTPAINLPTGGNAGFFTDNLQDGLDTGFSEIEVGKYQLDIRTSADYLAPNPFNPTLFDNFRPIDTNDRLAQGLAISVDSSAGIADGAILTLSDGVNQVNFEFDVTTGAGDSAAGTAPGNIPVQVLASDTTDVLAVKIRDAINSPSAQNLIDVSASVQSNGTTIVLHGPAAITRSGGITINNIPGLSTVLNGFDTSLGEDHGDRNRDRDQGVVFINSTTVSDSSQFGIVVDAATRVGGTAGSPGSPINYPTNNADSLAPGVVLNNNILDSNLQGGILISGDPVQPDLGVGQDMTRAATIARVVNNTIWGTESDQGILVNQGASPIILNNIIANTGTGIDVAGAQNTFVLGANLYFNNGVNVNPAGSSEAFRRVTSVSPFVDAANGNFYLTPGSDAIDSSLEVLAELASLTQVKSSLGLPPSPVIAPDRDAVGQRRVDDPNVNPPGLGFKDRGAFDRSDFVGLEAVLLQPLDNDSENVDVDRSNTYVRIVDGTLDFFSILLLEAQGGTGPDANTVTPQSITLTENGRLLSPGVDYVFGYNDNSRTVRLTPFAGLWRPDSVYEITLNNQDGIRVVAPSGIEIADGDVFTLNVGGTPVVFEYDNDGTVANGAVAVPFESTYSQYQVAAQIMAAINGSGSGAEAYLQGNSSVMVTGAATIDGLASTAVGAIRDIAGNALFANRPSTLTQFTIVMPEVQLDYGDAPGAGSVTVQADNGSRHALLPIDAPLLALGAFADGDVDGSSSASSRGDDNESGLVSTTIPGVAIGTAGQAILQMAAPNAGINGQQIVVTDPSLTVATFEFDTDAAVASGAIAVDVSAATTADEVAAALAAAVNQAVLDGNISGLSAFVDGDTVDLGGAPEHQVDISSAPSTTRLAVGSFDLEMPAAGYVDGQYIELRDGQGRAVRFELNDTSGTSGSPLFTAGNVAVNVDLSVATPEDITSAFAAAISAQVTAGTFAMGPASATGTTLSVAGDDEDGVHFGGLFNASSSSVPVTVTSTGPGILDAWIDWNADGDFADAGERIVEGLPIQAGDNVIDVVTPASAAIGFTSSRFRVSTTGNIDLAGIGVGGEVEDHLIEVVAGQPPVANDDAYEVDEDNVLTVTAPGILENDSDADSASFTVLDADVFTAGVQPISDVSNGVLVLSADGSFTYTPDLDFFGVDTFVYNVVDNRLEGSAPATVTITVNPVNDRPTAVDDEITIIEDQVLIRSGDVFTENDFKGIFGTPSQTNELGQNLAVVNAQIISPDTAVFGGSVSVVNNELTFTPGPHYNNEISGPVLVELTIRDSGTAGADEMPLEHTSTLTINIEAVNDAPEFSIPTTTGTEEDAGLVTVDGFVSELRPGPTQATDEATGPANSFEDQQVSFSVRALDPAQFAVLPSITPTTDANPGVLTYELVPHLNSASPFTEILVEVIAVDTGAVGGANMDVNTSAPQTFTILPTPINDAPEFDIPASTDSKEDEGVIVVSSFLTNLAAGPAGALDEATQALSVSIAADTAAFTATGYPTIDLGSGDLTYETAPHVNQFTGQSFEVVVTVSDDGGTNLGGVDRTTKTFVINVQELNDAPEFDMPTATSAFQEDPNADPGAPTVVPDFITNIMPGPAAATDEGPAREDQQVSFTVTALDPTLFDPAFLPAIDDTGELVYRLNPDVNDMDPFPAILVEVVAFDTGLNDGGTDVPRNQNTADPRTFTILPDPINDAPEFTIPASLTATEDEGVVTVVDFVTEARPGPVTALDELATQTMTITVEALDPTAFTATGQPAITLDAATGRGDLTFETNADVNILTGHDLRIRVILQDDGGVANPGDVDTTIKTFSLVVDPINDAPSFEIPTAEVTVLEDNEEVVGSSPTVIPGFATSIVAGPATALDETTIDATRQSLTFVTVDVSDPSLFEVQPSITPTGDLTFVTAQDQNGTATIVVHLLDDGVGPETGNGDDNQSRPDQTFTINITAVNDAPEFTVPDTVSSIEDQGLVQVLNFASDLQPGPDSATDEAGQQFTVNVAAVDPTAFTIQPEIGADGTLTFQTGPDVNSDNANLEVTVFLTDDGVDGPPPNTNTSPTVTFTILTEAINDAPSFSLASPQVSAFEDQEDFLNLPITSIPVFATDIVPGPATATDEIPQNVTFDIITVSAPELFDIQPTISPAGTLTFKTALHRNGQALVVVRAVDDGVGTPPPNNNASQLQTFTISIDAINDAPEFDIPANLTVNEDAGLVSASGFATNVRRGPVGTDDENGQIINFEVVADDPTAFSVQPAISPDGTLVFRSAPNVNSLNASLGVSVRLVDSGTAEPDPNVNVSPVQRFTIDINPVNDPPIADSFSVTGTEDNSIVIQAADVLAGDVPGPTSDELGQSLRMTTIERTSAFGGSIVPVFNGSEIESFTYTPPLNATGTDTFIYVVTDDGTPPRSGAGTITITLEGVNDAPQFRAGPNQTVAEDVDLVTVSNWATGILAGPPAATDEHATQSVVFQTTNNNTGLFQVQPEVASDGSLTFQPAVDANGTAVLTVVAIDDGPGDAPNVNTSAPQTFTITVNPVNDAPVFTAGANVSVAEDSGAFSAAWATDIAPAAGLLNTPQTATDETSQVVDFSVSASDPSLFAVQPVITSAGELQFTPQQDAFGEAVVTVVAVDRGPTGGMNQNSSAPQSFTITITPVNDQPTAIADALDTNENEVLSVAAPGLLANDTDVDLPGDSLSAVAETKTSTLGAVVVISSDGSVSYDPSAVQSIQQLTTGQSVLDSFTYRIVDAAGVESAAATVTLNVAGVDDPPVANDDAYTLGVGQTRLFDVLTNDTDVDTAIDPRTIVLTTIPIFGTATVSTTGVIEYTAGAGFRGEDQLGYRVSDTAGNLSNEAFVSITVNNPPVAVDDSAFTFKNEAVDIDVVANDSDPDGTINADSVQVVVAPSPAGTTEVLPGGVIRFTPATGFSGVATFSYVVSDDVGTDSNVADVTVRVQNSRWQNPAGNLDVNDDGFVSPIDALILVNYLNDANNETFLPNSGIVPQPGSGPYLDPNGDENISPVDVLMVINFLNSNSGGGGGEGEFVTEDYAMMVTPLQMIETVGDEVVRQIKAAMDESMMEELADESEAPFIGPVLPAGYALIAEGEGEEDDDLLDAIAMTCDADELKKSSLHDAVDEIFGDMGPFRS